jgi:ligand-binding sensor domain-containing protein
MLQDRDGNYWFGTTSDGVMRYDGQHLDQYTPAAGFASQWVSAMVEDARGELWFGTGGGVSRYDGRSFTNYTTKDGLASDQVWCLLWDRDGGLWVGTEEGVSRFNGRTFTPFAIPAADLSQFPYYKYPRQINAMVQDRAGNIWFGTNGGGVYRYDGRTLTNLSEADGLCNNFVQTILEDRAGKLWFGTRYGGLCRYDPALKDGRGAFTEYPRETLKGDDIWTLYETRDGTLWVAVARTGLCSYDGVSFTCYDARDGAGIRVVQSLLEDANGQLWVGTSHGVYRFDGGRFTNWAKWEAIGE